MCLGYSCVHWGRLCALGVLSSEYILGYLHAFGVLCAFEGACMHLGGMYLSHGLATPRYTHILSSTALSLLPVS